MNHNNWFQNIINELNGFVHIAFGAIFVIIGIIGIFVPIIPGMLLIFLGIYLLGGRKLVHKIKALIIKNNNKD